MTNWLVCLPLIWGELRSLLEVLLSLFQPIQDNIEGEDITSINKYQANPKIDKNSESNKTINCIEVDFSNPTPDEPTLDKLVKPIIQQSKYIRGLIPDNKSFNNNKKYIISYYKFAFSGYFNLINKRINIEINQ